MITPIRLLFGVAILLLISSQLPTRVASQISELPRSIVDKAESTLTIHLHDLSVSLREPQEVRELRHIEETSHGNYQDVLGEIERLRQDNDRLRKIIAEYKGGEVVGREGLRPVLAKVSSIQIASKVMIIDKGFKQGLTKGQAVVSETHLVGRVASVTAGTSTVDLITKIGTSMQVRFSSVNDDLEERREWVGLIEIDSQGGFFSVVSDDVDIRSGDAVRLMSVESLWPEVAGGKIIGKVSSISEDEEFPTLRKRINIKPSINFNRLSRVVVLVTEKNVITQTNQGSVNP